MKSFNLEFKPLIEEINAKEEAISRYADAATMERIKRTILEYIVLDTIVGNLTHAYRH